MDEMELFTRRYDDVDADRLWAALKRTLATMDLREADDEQRQARFGTGLTTWSFGQHNLASVEADGASGSVLTVRGRPKGSFLTTRFGEGRHAKRVEQMLTKAIDDNLGSATR